MAFRIAPLQIANLTSDFGNGGALAANIGGQFLGGLEQGRKRADSETQKQNLALLGQDINAGNYQGAAARAFALGDLSGGAGILSLGQKQQSLEAQKGITSLLGGGSPVTPTATLGNPTEIESRFVGAVKQAGLTNPVGLGAVAAYGKAESGYSPQNANRVWNDPSESGQPGQSGGIMSWRADRLQNLYKFAEGRGEKPGAISPETQGLFLTQEDPTLVPRLNAAKTPQEANQIMANAWRFAGYDREGGENARRAGLTEQYAARFAGQPSGQPQAAQAPAGVAQSGGTYAGVPPERLQAFIDSPRVPENYKAMMRTELASRQPAAPVQVAEAAPQAGAPVADVPAQGAATVTGPGTTQAAQAPGFAIPGTSLPPNDPAPGATTQQLMGIVASPQASEGQRALAQSILANRQKYTDENAPDKRAMVRAQAEKADLEVKKLRRDVEGEGARPMTRQERIDYSVPEGQPAYMTGKGEPKFGPASTRINNSIGATEGEYAKANGKAISERFSKIVEEGDAAAMEAGAIARLRELGGSIKNMGAGAALQARLAEWGVKVGENVSEIEAYNALIDKLTPQQRIAGAGATSDFDAKMFKGSLPSLVRTPEGNKLIIDTMDALNTYKRQRADIVGEAMALNEKPPEVMAKLKALPDPFAAFKEARKTSMGGGSPEAGQPTAAASPSQAAPQQAAPRSVATPQDYQALKSGDTYVDPQGNTRRKP